MFLQKFQWLTITSTYLLSVGLDWALLDSERTWLSYPQLRSAFVSDCAAQRAGVATTWACPGRQQKPDSSSHPTQSYIKLLLRKANGVSVHSHRGKHVTWPMPKSIWQEWGGNKEPLKVPIITAQAIPSSKISIPSEVSNGTGALVFLVHLQNGIEVLFSA